MPPMPHDMSPEPIVDADVVEDVDRPVAPDPAADVGEDVDRSAAPDEQVEGMPVLAEVRSIATPSPALLPAVQAAAVAATGFVAGAATLALVKRHSARKLARTRQTRRALDTLPIVGSRSFLVDVHLIARDPGGSQ